MACTSSWADNLERWNPWPSSRINPCLRAPTNSSLRFDFVGFNDRLEQRKALVITEISVERIRGARSVLRATQPDEIVRQLCFSVLKKVESFHDAPTILELEAFTSDNGLKM